MIEPIKDISPEGLRAWEKLEKEKKISIRELKRLAIKNHNKEHPLRIVLETQDDEIPVINYIGQIQLWADLTKYVMKE